MRPLRSLLMTLLMTVPLAASSSKGILLELFTSEGCSSCPPADRLLEELDQKQPIPGATLIVLSEHVDYWDGIGWRDRFSQKAFTDRQQAYANTIRGGDVYTPQLVVQGRVGLVGNQRGDVLHAINEEAKRDTAPLSADIVERTDKSVKLRVHGDFKNADLVYAIAMDQATSDVRGGENSGRKLRHVAVVQKLNRIGAYKDGSEVVIPINSATQRIVLFVQKPGPGEVLAAAVVRH